MAIYRDWLHSLGTRSADEFSKVSSTNGYDDDGDDDDDDDDGNYDDDDDEDDDENPHIRAEDRLFLLRSQSLPLSILPPSAF